MTWIRFYNVVAALSWIFGPFILNYAIGPLSWVVMFMFIILSIFVVDRCIRDFIDNKL